MRARTSSFSTAGFALAVTLTAWLLPAPEVRAQAPLGTAFSYQGRLTDGGSPADGDYDFQFLLYDDPSVGNLLGTVVVDDLAVAVGQVDVQLDFGGAVFEGAARWLEVQVRAGSSVGAYTTLTPRQPITPAPYAIYSKTAPWSALLGVPAGFADGVDDSGPTYSAGIGLTLNANEFSVADLGVSTGKLANLGVTAAKLADLSVTSAKLADLAVTTAKLAVGAVTGAKISSSGAASGQALTFNGSAVVWGAPQASSLALPLLQTVSTGNDAFHITNSGTGAAASFERTTTAFNYPTLFVDNSNGNGIFVTTAGAGADGLTTFVSSNGGHGVFAQHDGPLGSAGRFTLYNSANPSPALYASTPGPGHGVEAYANATTGARYGVYARSSSSGGKGVYGWAAATTGSTHGVMGESDSVDGVGVYGTSPYRGTLGWSTSTTGGAYGAYGRTDSNAGKAVYAGAYSATGTTYGLYTEVASTSGYLIYGVGQNDAGGTDVDFYVTDEGDVRADGTFTSPAADYAELLPSDGTDAALEPGDVISLSEKSGAVCRSRRANDPAVLGVYSTKPGFVGGAPDSLAEPPAEDLLPVALVGIVPVKVCGENGPIRIGDLLTSSATPGHAMKAAPIGQLGGRPVYEQGTMIGKAMENWDGAQGTITLLVLPR